MTAPGQIWAWPWDASSKCGEWDAEFLDAIGISSYEYLRADLIPAMLRAEREKALRDAHEACLLERGPVPKLFATASDDAFFDGAQACADAVGALIEGEPK